MPGIDIDKLEQSLPGLRRDKETNDRIRDSAYVSAQDLKTVFGQFLFMMENCLFELKEQRNTIASRDREIEDLQRRLRLAERSDFK